MHLMYFQKLVPVLIRSCEILYQMFGTTRYLNNPQRSIHRKMVS